MKNALGGFAACEEGECPGGKTRSEKRKEVHCEEFCADLRGPFGNASVGAGAGVGATADGFWGASDHGVVVGGSATFGPSLGVTSFNGITNTYVQPVR